MSYKRLLYVCGFLATASLTFGDTVWTVNSGGNSASADFNFSVAGQVTITLTDTVSNPGSVASNLSAFMFGLDNNGTALNVGSLSSGAGVERTVAGDGSYIDGSSVAAGWVFSLSSGTYALDVLSGGGAGPAHTIIGTPDGSNVYSNANSSIAGNGPHNPFLTSGTFVITITGVNSNTTVDFANFQFGTTDGSGIIDGSCTTDCGTIPPQSIPEPTSLLLGGTGFAALGLVGWRRRRANRA